MKLTQYLLCLAVPVFLSGCDPLMRGSWDTLRAATEGPQRLELTQAQVDASPYYQIKVQTPTSEAVLGLVRQQGDLQFWLTSQQQVLLIRDGLVVRSVGLGADLDATRLAQDSPFHSGLHHIENNQRSTRWVDFNSDNRIGVALQSRFNKEGMEQVDILDRSYTLLRVDEHIEAPSIGFSAINRYWVDPKDGFIMMSRQHISPQITLGITQLRPYRTPAL